MDTSNGKTKELRKPKFKTVKNGLDEAEVFSYINELIEQNKNLSSKLEHIDSLTRLAERTVIEADSESERIKKEIEENANAKAAATIAEAEKKAKTEANSVIAEAQRRAEQRKQELVAAAEEQAQTILKDAVVKAEKIESDANEEANNTIAEAEQKASSIEQQAEDTLKSAQEKSEAIKSDADKKAARILSESREKGDELLKLGTANAEKEAQIILMEAKEKAEQVLRKSKKVAETEIREKLKKVYHGLLSNLEGIGEETIMPAIEESKRAEQAAPEPEASMPSISMEAALMAEELQEQPSPSQKRERRIKEAKAEEGSKLYAGTMELVIPPPLGLDRMLQLHKHLRNIPDAKVLNLGVATDKSITIRILLENPTPLLDILADLPEVEKALDDLHDSEISATTRKSGDKALIKRITVITKK
jgi:cell division septum initiation protein DivIVA